MNPDAATAPPADDDPVLRQLMNQAQLIGQLRRDLDALAHEATDTVAGLLARMEDLETRTVTTGRVPTSWCWRTIGPHGADELWAQLTDWVTWIRSRYPLARKIPPCWADHPNSSKSSPPSTWPGSTPTKTPTHPSPQPPTGTTAGSPASSTGSSTAPSHSTAPTSTNPGPGRRTPILIATKTVPQ